MGSAQLHQDGGTRAIPDLVALLLDLLRVLKAIRLYGRTDARVAALFERGLRSWRADLARAGALDVMLGPEGLMAAPGGEPLAGDRLHDLSQLLRERGVARLRVDPNIDAEAFAALLHVLTAAPEALRAEGGTARALEARAPLGIAVEELLARNPPPREPDEEAGRARGNGQTPPPEPETETAPLDEAPAETSERTPPSPGEDETAPLAHEILPLAEEPEPEGPATAAAAAGADTAVLELVDEADFPAPKRPREPAEAGPPAGPRPDLAAVEAAPLERGVRDAQSAELVDVLRELDGCESNPEYVDLARRAVHLARQAYEAQREDDAYRVMLVLADHAAQGSKRGEKQSAVASEFLASAATGQNLERLVERACAPGNETGVRATQVLLQLGTPAVGALLRAAERERDDRRRGAMHGILIALGELALPELLRSLEDEDPERVRTALRLVGDIQSPEAVPRLAVLLGSADAKIREEAAKALVRIGGDRSLDALIRALRSRTPGMAALAVYCLAATASPRAVNPLLATLDEAIDSGRTDLARETIRALARLGRPEATPRLAALLLRRSLLGRRRLRELKVAAATALGSLPGDEAVGALAQAASTSEAAVRQAAKVALERRARSALAQH